MDPQKLRLMCSYGGHIVARPHDNTLCYAGGETRIIAVDRKTALSYPSLTTHLSKTILNNKPFTLKYQLPNHDLDSLVSITSDEDLSNMVEEYDRLALITSPPSRLRFFLTPLKDLLLHDPTSDEWFVDALRNVGVLESAGNSNAAESIVFEKDCSFGSGSSSASASNSHAIVKGGGDDGVVGVKVAQPLIDSFGSDSTLPSPSFSPHAVVYQDASGFAESKVVSTNLVETESNTSDRSPRADLLAQQVPVSGYVIPKPIDQLQQATPRALPPATPQQHQYFHPPTQTPYIPQYYNNPVPVTPYPAMYQPYVHPQQHVQYPISKPCPVYMMPVGQPHNAYDPRMPVGQPHNAYDPRSLYQGVAASHHQAPSHPVMVSSPMGYNGYKPTKPLEPEYATNMFRATAVAATQPATITSDHHHQVVGFPAVNQIPQPVAAAAPLETSNYVSEFEDPMRAQIYKTQPSGPTMAPQFQATTKGAAVMLSETFTQLHAEKPKR